MEQTKRVWSERSRKALEGIHPDLLLVTNRALVLSPLDFTVLQGMRSQYQQAQNVKKGVSWTKNSRHLTGHAIDFVPFVNGKIDFQNLDNFKIVADAFFQAAKELGIQIRWGGDWNENGNWKDEIKRGVYDGGHIELSRKHYP